MQPDDPILTSNQPAADGLSREPVALSAFPDEAWVATCRDLGEEVCRSLDFPEPLVERVAGAIDSICLEINRLCQEREPGEPVVLRLAYHDGAIVMEFDYPGTVPLDPRRAGVKGDSLPTAAEDLRLTVDDLWIERVKALMDRVAFSEDGNRWVIETRLYHRTEGELRRFWLMGLCPRLKPEVVLHEGADGAGILQAENTGKTLYLDSAAGFVARRLDGAHTFHQIYLDYVDKVGLIPPERLALIFESLEGHGMLASDEVRPKRETGWARWAHAIDHRLRRSVTLPRGEELVEAVYGRLGFLFKLPVLAALGLFVLSGLYPLFVEIDHPHELLTKPFHAVQSDVTLLVELYVFLLIVGSMHELAHALACRHFGGRVRRLGLMTYLGLVLFFADTSSAWVFRDRWKRIAVAMAGPAVNLIIMSACFWIWEISKDDGPPEYSIWFLGGFFCLYTTLMNLIPLIKMDGYFALADLLDMRTLREKSFEHVGRRIASLFGGNRPVPGAPPTIVEEVIYWVYGVLGAVFTALIFAVIVIAVVHNVTSEEVPEVVAFLSLLFVSTALYTVAYQLYGTFHARTHWRVVIT